MGLLPSQEAAATRWSLAGVRRALPLRDGVEIAGAYAYQFANQMPQLLAVPFLAKVASASAMVEFAKYFIIISLINIFTDWGYTTVGSQNLFKHQADRRAMSAVFWSGERMRWTLWYVLGLAIGPGCLLVMALIREGRVGVAAAASAGIVALGSLCSVVFPNWLVVGTRLYGRFTAYLFLLRALSILVLILVASMTGEVATTMFAYFGFILVTNLVMRHIAKRDAKIEDVALTAFDLRSEIRSGLIIMLGAGLTYCFLNTGVFFMDRFATKVAAASFAVADRVLALARAAYAPLIQHIFVGIQEDSKMAGRIQRRYIAMLAAGTFAVWAGGKLAMVYFFRDPAAERFFDVLIVGFGFLGFSHYYVTLRVLGHGHLKTWLKILFGAFLAYLAALCGFVVLHGAEPGRGVAYSIVTAETAVLALGLLYNWEIDRAHARR